MLFSQCVSLVRKHRVLLILGGIFLLAFFLRAYHFEEWLRFNEDQMRDGLIVDSILAGEELPLLGPKAGGTDFKLGPAFYYLEASGTWLVSPLLSSTPVALALPVLLFSLLFLFLFFRIAELLFTRHVALLSTFLLGVSFFAIKYSRFAWNPNLVPFFGLFSLYALFKILTQKEMRWRWPVLAGISIGIGIQLHVLLFLILPTLFLLTLLFALRKKLPLKRAFLVTSCIVVFLNAPQLLSEYGSGLANSQAFFASLQGKTNEGFTPKEKITHALTCSIQGNVAMLSSLKISDDCDLFSAKNRTGRFFWPLVGSGALFLGGGILLLFRSFRTHLDPAKRLLLGLIMLYSAFFFGVLIPLGEEVSLRFFIALLFFPFLLFGFWCDYLLTWHKKGAALFILLMTLLLAGSNLLTFTQVYITQTAESKYFGGTRLGDMEPVARFIAEDIREEKKGDSPYYILDARPVKAIAYLARKKGATNLNPTNFDTLRSAPVAASMAGAYLIDELPETGEDGKKKKQAPKNLTGFTVQSETEVGRYLVTKIRSNVSQ